MVSKKGRSSFCFLFKACRRDPDFDSSPKRWTRSGGQRADLTLGGSQMGSKCGASPPPLAGGFPLS